MAKFARFEDIEAWKVARVLANQVYDLSDKGPFSRDFGLRDQMRRAAVSILSNVAAWFERDGNNEFLQFLSHAKGSAGELRAQSYIAFDRKSVSQTEFDAIQQQASQINRLLSGLMKYLQHSELSGRKRPNRSQSPSRPSSEA